MLFVMLMAGIAAIMLYRALPRAAFESERDKEQVLIDRGEQYKRAIQLYVRQNKRWPAKIEDLESTNGKRYLRRRYIDPMTGKDEWRAVHVGPTGVLTDSLVKPLKKDQGSQYNNTFITELGGVSGAPEAATAGNPGLRKRPSDQNPAGPGSTDGSQPPPQPPGSLAANGALNGGFPNGAPTPFTPQPGQPNLPPGLTVPTGVQPGAPNNGLQLPQNGGGGGISVLGGVGGIGYSTAPGANGNTQPPLPGTLNGQTTGAPFGAQGQQAGFAGAAGTTPGNAASLIQGILTTPRPGGLPGSALGTGIGGVQGGGIAGFASKFEGEGIKVYNDQNEIQKWEFVYDMSKDAMITGGQNAMPQPAGQNGLQPANGQTTTTNGGFNTGSAFNVNGSTTTPSTTPTTVGH